jgi:excisionase family DNA binding protein
MTGCIPQLLSLGEVAKLLSVSSHTVRSWARTGKLRPVRICRRLLFDPRELEKFLQEAKARTPAGRECESARD